ncbi:hypothetical protein AGMMS49975_15920 [Clostridia bacterium]|nr:hypothetical protein AGMMS49975_15920 [Clostridia bacterium]
MDLGKLSDSELRERVEDFHRGQQSGAYTREQEQKTQTELLREANERFMANNPPNRR